MSTEYVFTCVGLNKKYDDHHVLKDITLSFLPGAKIGVIGQNGAGKSTLLRILSGEDKNFEGMAEPGKGVRVGYVSQEPPLDETLDVRGNVELAVAPVRKMLEEYNELSAKMGEDLPEDEYNKVMDRFSVLSDLIEARNAWELDRELDQAMHALNLPPGDADVSKLSGGERRRIALCRTLMEQPELLLLDEPTNHLDAETVAWLEHHLAEYPGCVILITHDRYFLDNVVGWMLEIDRGGAIPYEGNYSAFLNKKKERYRIEERAEASRRKMIDRELEWLSKTPKARTAKSKARIREFDALVAQQKESKDEQIRLRIPSGRRLGDKVMTFENVSKSFGDKVLMKDLSFDLPAGGIIGVIGVNGAGKTTLLRLITEQMEPDSGTITRGDTVELCYVDQLRDTLDPKKNVWQEISGGDDVIQLGKQEITSRHYVSWFNFKGPDQQKLLSECSGGMRNRVQMAKMLRRGGNLLLLDEPTNDLDLDTLRILEEAIQEFPGCAVIVTHDRYFLDRVATHIMAFEGEGKVRYFEGSYSLYEERRTAERAEAGLGPESQAGKYRKLKGN